MSDKHEKQKDEFLWFHIQSRSDASRLVGSHIGSKIGPFVRNTEQLAWKEWKKNSEEDKLLSDELALSFKDEDDSKTPQKPDQQIDEKLSEVIYREKLVENIKFFWLRKRSLFPFAYHKRYHKRNGEGSIRLVNHTAGEMHLTQKAMLVRCLIDYYGPRGYFDFHPHTYIFCLRAKIRGNHSRKHTAQNVMSVLIPDIELLKIGSIPRLWIIKPSTGSCGRGISILELYDEDTDSKQVKSEEVLARINKFVKSTTSEKSPELIYQSYIDKPLLYKGYKFDFRVYLMIASVQDPFIALYTKEGYLRICSDPYDSDVTNRNAHITNFHVQRDHPLYDKETDSIQGRTTRVEYNDFIEYLKEVNFANNFTDEEKEKIRTQSPQCTDNEMIISLLDTRVSYCIGKAVKSSIDKISGHPNCCEGQFALLGIDLLLDTSGGVWLIEFTKSPAFRMQPDYLKSLHTRVLTECVDIAMDIEATRESIPAHEKVNPSTIKTIANSTAWKLLPMEQ